MEKRRVVITGLGTVNPTGNTVAESWQAVKAGKSGIGPITAFGTTNFKAKLAAEVKNFDPTVAIDKREAKKIARYAQFALCAAAEALADSGLDMERENAARVGCIVSSGIGSLPDIEASHAKGMEKGFDRVSPYFIPMAIGNMAAAQIAIRYGLKGMCVCPVTACAGGSNAVGDAFHRVRDGYEEVMVCGGAEACISELGIGGFTCTPATTPPAPASPLTWSAAASSWARAAAFWCWRSWSTPRPAARRSTPRWWATAPTAMPTTSLLPHPAARAVRPA